MPKAARRTAKSSHSMKLNGKERKSSTSSNEPGPTLRRSCRPKSVDRMAYNAHYHAMDETTRPARARAIRHRAGEYSQPQDSEDNDDSVENNESAIHTTSQTALSCTDSRLQTSKKRPLHPLDQGSDDDEYNNSTSRTISGNVRPQARTGSRAPSTGRFISPDRGSDDSSYSVQNDQSALQITYGRALSHPDIGPPSLKKRRLLSVDQGSDADEDYNNSTIGTISRVARPQARTRSRAPRTDRLSRYDDDTSDREFIENYRMKAAEKRRLRDVLSNVKTGSRTPFIRHLPRSSDDDSSDQSFIERFRVKTAEKRHLRRAVEDEYERECKRRQDLAISGPPTPLLPEHVSRGRHAARRSEYEDFDFNDWRARDNQEDNLSRTQLHLRAPEKRRLLDIDHGSDDDEGNERARPKRKHSLSHSATSEKIGSPQDTVSIQRRLYQQAWDAISKEETLCERVNRIRERYITAWEELSNTFQDRHTVLAQLEAVHGVSAAVSEARFSSSPAFGDAPFLRCRSTAGDSERYNGMQDFADSSIATFASPSSRAGRTFDRQSNSHEGRIPAEPTPGFSRNRIGRPSPSDLDLRSRTGFYQGGLPSVDQRNSSTTLRRVSRYDDNPVISEASGPVDSSARHDNNSCVQTGTGPSGSPAREESSNSKKGDQYNQNRRVSISPEVEPMSRGTGLASPSPARIGRAHPTSPGLGYFLPGSPGSPGAWD